MIRTGPSLTASVLISTTISPARFEGPSQRHRCADRNKSDGALYFTDAPYGLFPCTTRTRARSCRSAVSFGWPGGSSNVFTRTCPVPTRSRSHPMSAVSTCRTRRHRGSCGCGLKSRKMAPFCAGPGGIWAFSPDGKHFGSIQLAELPANCAWGGRDGHDLYMTARTGLYPVHLKVGHPAVRSIPSVPNAKFHKLLHAAR